jgi:hypothetical protein
MVASSTPQPPEAHSVVGTLLFCYVDCGLPAAAALDALLGTFSYAVDPTKPPQEAVRADADLPPSDRALLVRLIHMRSAGVKPPQLVRHLAHQYLDAAAAARLASEAAEG